MQDKTCLVTGANSGIGLETARGLAKLGARVIMVCRDPAKGAAARQEIMASSGNGQVDLLIADFASLASVREAAREITGKYNRLHVLVNNAGLMTKQRQTSVDGYEMQFAVHHLAVFLFTTLLLDLLKQSAPARIVNVASMVHKMGRLQFDDLQCERKFGMYGAYGQSKLAVIHFTYDLAEKLKGSGVTCNCLHPGAVATNLAGAPGWMRWFMADAAKGARTSLYLATSPEVEGVSGQYFANCKATKSSRISHDREIGQRLWQVTEKLCGLAGS